MLLYLSQIVDEGTRDTREKEADVYIRPNVSGTGLLDWDPDTQMQLIQEGHSAALAALSKLKLDQTATWQKVRSICVFLPSAGSLVQLCARVCGCLFCLALFSVHRYCVVCATFDARVQPAPSQSLEANCCVFGFCAVDLGCTSLQCGFGACARHCSELDEGLVLGGSERLYTVNNEFVCCG